MTVHKAKGLGFPVVILLLYGRASKGFSYVLKDITGTDMLTLTRLNRKIADIVPSLGNLYDELSIKETVNILNSMYVALTRAEAEMYVICVNAKSGDRGFHACRYLPAEEYSAEVMPNEIYPGELRKSTRMKLRHGAMRSIVPVLERRHINLIDKVRGEYIHRILAEIDIWESGDELLLRAVIDRVGRRYPAPCPADEVFRLLYNFLLRPDISVYFCSKKGRVVKTETEIADSKGNLFRIDRLIDDGDSLFVMDFKSGDADGHEDQHHRQVRDYMDLVGSIYPDRPVRGLIAYIETGMTRMVS
jgi:ATP-dependent helicase/nuclease subunit A